MLCEEWVCCVGFLILGFSEVVGRGWRVRLFFFTLGIDP